MCHDKLLPKVAWELGVVADTKLDKMGVMNIDWSECTLTVHALLRRMVRQLVLMSQDHGVCFEQ
jgi:hypothetical protein